ncbi:hypothetical protein [Burkholderia ubonensis]|uniref:hypothetical protein n=1 Tax=Burkholderia ubonensis TaxID=101571 RepID=UPI0007598C6F|nr:hypothetical protein [Burkholderia ubonensis]KVZ62230.1 hypothetical protein WL19_30070 [Burkholderia ubonensis]
MSEIVDLKVELEELIARIKDRIENFGQSDVCWPWKGAKTKAGPRLKMARTSDMVPFYQPAVVTSYGLVKIGKGRRKVVHKIVYEWATPDVAKSDRYRLVNECGNTLCCNYTHWRFIDNGPPTHTEGEDTPDAKAVLKEACVELLESMLAVTQPRSLADVMNHPYMVDFQPELIKEVLRDIGKGHLVESAAGDTGPASG